MKRQWILIGTLVAALAFGLAGWSGGMVSASTAEGGNLPRVVFTTASDGSNWFYVRVADEYTPDEMLAILATAEITGRRIAADGTTFFRVGGAAATVSSNVGTQQDATLSITASTVTMNAEPAPEGTTLPDGPIPEGSPIDGLTIRI